MFDLPLKILIFSNEQQFKWFAFYTTTGLAVCVIVAIIDIEKV